MASRMASIGEIAGRSRGSRNEFRDEYAKISESCWQSSFPRNGWETYKNGSRRIPPSVRRKTAPSPNILRCAKSLFSLLAFLSRLLTFSLFSLFATQPIYLFSFPCHFPSNITTTCWRDNKFRSFFSRPTLWHPLHIPLAFSTPHPRWSLTVVLAGVLLFLSFYLRSVIFQLNNFLPDHSELCHSIAFR